MNERKRNKKIKKLFNKFRKSNKKESQLLEQEEYYQATQQIDKQKRIFTDLEQLTPYDKKLFKTVIFDFNRKLRIPVREDSLYLETFDSKERWIKITQPIYIVEQRNVFTLRGFKLRNVVEKCYFTFDEPFTAFSINPRSTGEPITLDKLSQEDLESLGDEVPKTFLPTNKLTVKDKNLLALLTTKALALYRNDEDLRSFRKASKKRLSETIITFMAGGLIFIILFLILINFNVISVGHLPLPSG